MIALTNPLARWAVAVAVAALLVVGAYWRGHAKGYAEADQRARVAELQAALEVAYQDLNAQRVAAEHSRRAAVENARAADEAEERLNDYAKALEARGDVARCLVGPDDLVRLRKYGIGSDHAAPARR